MAQTPEDQMSDDTLRRLHDKATRGEQLTPEEYIQLEAWYIENDQQERNELSPSNAPEEVAELRRKLDEAMSELSMASHRVRELTADNESARQENGDLRRQLVR